MKAFNPFDHPIALVEPLRLAPSGWLMHVPFAMTLIDLVRPRLLVELGTHHGVSYGAFCQAVKALDLPTRCFAVDTWKGDSQAGFYDPDVLENLRAHHDGLYTAFSTLLQSTFDDALSSFADHSIDLLHIDGCHTYEDVRHDFEAWLPKVSQRGIVLLHDTHVSHGDFGVWRLWEELQTQYPSLDIPFGNGLGILAVGTTIPEGLQTLLDLPDDQKTILLQYFERLGQRVEQTHNMRTLEAEKEEDVEAERQMRRNREHEMQRIIEQYEWLLNQQQAEQTAQPQLTNERAYELENLQALTDFLTHHTQQLEQQLDMITSTRAWRAAQMWYQLKQGQLPDFITSQRLRELTVTARNIIRNEGFGAFARRMYLWTVKGERRFYRKSLNIANDGTSRPERREAQAAAPSLPAPAESNGGNSAAALTDNFRQRLAALFQQATPQDSRYVSVLNWDTSLDIASAFPEQAVFSPPLPGIPLPYLDSSIEVVILKNGSAEKLAEAERVARTLIISLDHREEVIARWKMGEPAAAARSLPSFSLILPVYNHLDYTENCLKQMIETIPSWMDVEIIVIDDCSTIPGVYETLKTWEARDPRIQVHRNPENMNYLMTCKIGASRATKDIIVTLNNDILPQTGWIEALAQTFVDFPDAGVVGGLLIYPDGRLQEAGASIFSDANAWNIGRLESPDSPQYNYVRKVDYVSGALMATPRSLWKETGGFDELFRPIYYEDSDYCLTVKSRGYSVYVQPQCRIIHFEGVTSGTDPSKKDSPKHYQQLNAAKFAEKWKDVLRNQPPPPTAVSTETMLRLALVGSRTDVRRVLICAPVMPEFDRESGSRRFLHFIEMFQKLGWEVTLLIQNALKGERYVSLLQQRGVAVFSGAPHFDYPEILLRAGQFDLVLTVFWEFGEYFNPRVRYTLPKARFAVDTIDLHFIRHARDAFLTHPESGLDPAYGERLARELNTYHASDAVITVSDKEAQWVNDFLVDKQNAYCIPDSEVLERSPLPFRDRRGILFIGNFRHPPNVQAYHYLINAIVPLLDPALLEKHPIYVVGNEMERFLGKAVRHGVPNVHMVGWVPSVIPYLEQCAISIIPLQIGAGTKRKLLQSLMIGTPSVSTPIGIEGMHLTHEQEVLVADTPETFVDQINRLLSDEALWSRLAEHGRQHAMAHFSKDVVETRLRMLLDRLNLN